MAEKETDNDELQEIAEQFAESTVSDGYLDPDSRYEKGEEFGYED